MDFQYNTFINGLVTDATDTNAPENSLKESVNMDIGFDGSIFRRNALEAQLNLEYHTTPDDACTFKYLIWEADEGYTYRIAIQTFHIGGSSYMSYIMFYEYSTGTKLYTVNQLNSVAGEIDFAFGKNSCYIATGSDVYYIEANSDGSLSTKADIVLAVRDVAGIDDSLSLTSRPATLSDAHYYNLKNQGWGVTINEYSTATSRIDYDHVLADKSVYPSNSDTPTVALQENPDASEEKRFRTSNLFSSYLGSSRAPRGSVLIYINKESLTNTENGFTRTLNLTALGKCTLARPTTVAFNSGRVFYAGLTGTKEYASTIFFSKTLTSNLLAGDCYQDADPTSGEISDLIDTDGGTIPIPEANGIFKLESYKTTLLVFAKNGVWGVTGASDAGFTATSYRVYKIADISPLSGSISLTEFGVVFATKEGIFTLQADQVADKLQPLNLLSSKVQTLYNNLTTSQKSSVRLAYDSSNKRLYIGYNDTAGVFKNILVFNATLQCFYTYEFEVDSVVGMFEAPDSFFIQSEEDIVDSLGDNVVDSLGDTVTVPIKISQNIPTKVEFLIQDTTLKMATLTSTSYSDMGTAPYNSSFTTNPHIFADLARQKQVYNLIAHFKKTETGYIEDVNGDMILQNPSSCLLQPRWDFAESATTGKLSREYQAYRHKRLHIPDETLSFTNFTVVSSKSKLRGSGRALQLSFSSESDKHLNMIGYTLDVKTRGTI